jgi:3-oxoacyl-(acyl-carrier-protein) synthase III
MLGVVARRAQAAGMSAAEQDDLRNRIGRMFDRAGSRQRFINAELRRGSAIDMVKRAGTEAIAAAGKRPEDIDLIIYCSVSRGWLEPSTAAAVQAALGATNASCFDVVEACAGWMRAVEVAVSLMAGGRYANALVVGVEDGLQDIIMPVVKGTRIADENLAGFTVGSAATATLLEPDDTQPVEIEIRSKGTLHDICMLPLASAAAFLPDDGRELPVADMFLSHSEPLFSNAIQLMVEAARPRLATLDMETVALFIPHAASTKAAEVLRKLLRVPEEKWLCPHGEFGNTVAMAMPVALDFAIRTGRVKRGDRIFFVVAGAGISYGYGLVTY